MNHIIKLLFIVLPLMCQSCSVKSERRLLFVGDTRQNIKLELESLDEFYGTLAPSLHASTSGDTIHLDIQTTSTKLETFFYMKGDTCTYQEVFLDCAKCTENAIDAILNDRTYAFEAIENGNYIGSKNGYSVLLTINENMLNSGNLCTRISGKIRALKRDRDGT